MKYELSVIIPARNEQFLKNTVEDILKNKRGKTEIIVGLDGKWSNPPLLDHSDVTILYYPESIGQRAISNRCVSLSKAKYIMKLDAHCALDEGFDVKLMKVAEGHDDWTILPKMYNLHAFDWKCKKCGNQWYQGHLPKHCMVRTGYDSETINPKCDGMEFERIIIWKPRLNKESTNYRFDTTLHFQYAGDHKHRGNNDKLEIVETMSAQGSCFMLTREKYWELNISDEAFGSWGQQGTEVACKTWLSGGRLVTYKGTWYAHMFRTKGGDFGFPYDLDNRQVENARKLSRKLFLENTWEGQIHPISWLIDKFKPLPDWHDPKNKGLLDRKPTKGALYYTTSDLPKQIEEVCQKQLCKGMKQKHIVSVSLKPMQFGRNIVLPLQKSWLTMFKQILTGLEALTTDIVYLIDHDVLYHPSHFAFVPPDKEHFYYNLNCWRIRPSDGFALHYDFASGCVAYRELLVNHYKKRIAYIEAIIAKGEKVHYQKMGFEAGNKKSQVFDPHTSKYFKSEFPNIDIRWGGVNTGARWKKEEFRDKSTCQNWQESSISAIVELDWPNLPELVEKFNVMAKE